MPDVFLSYSRTDRPIAQAIATELQRLGVDVWWDHDLLGGDDYRQRIAAVLARAKATIVIWSRRSVDSQWVVGEASAAREAKTLVPLNIDGAQAPLDFRSLHAIDFTDWVPGDPLPDTLLKALSDKLAVSLSYQVVQQRTGTVSRLTHKATQSWYADFESLLFYFIGQGFACSLFNLPPVIYGSKIPSWAPLLMAVINGMIAAAIHMRPALEGRRMGVAVPLFIVATAISIPAYAATAWLYANAEKDAFLTIVAFWALGLLLVTDIARRAGERGR